jgi:carbon-monoxide dehydrogenase medium subunit
MGSDPPPALLALDASVECVSPRGARTIPVRDFFTGYFETCIEPDEILAAIHIPPQPARSSAVYLKHTTRSGDLAIVGVAVRATLRDGICEDIRIALGGVGPVPYRAYDAENLLLRTTLQAPAMNAAARSAAESSDPLSDAHASAGYRRKMVAVFVKRALEQMRCAAQGNNQ